MDERVAQIGDVEICYETMGERSGWPLVLIMGLGGPMTWWEPGFCRMLTDRGFRVVRFDNRDCGRSTQMLGRAGLVRSYLRPARHRGYTLEAMAADVIGLLDHLGLPSVDVAGVSMGGMIAQLMAIRYPRRVRSLVSIMSTTGSRRVGWTHPRVLVGMLRPVPRTEADYVDTSLRAFRRIGTREYLERDTDRMRARAVTTYARGVNPAGTARQIAAILAAGDRTPALRRLRVPALVMHGTADPLIHVSGGRATARAIPGCELVTLPGVGHDMPARLWPVFADAIERTSRRAGDPRPIPTG